MSRFVPCPSCGTDDWYTTETRRSDKGIRRRRRCVHCDHGVTTWEVLSTDLAEFKRGEIDKAKKHAQKALQILEELGERE
jgi:transcriptional regulator NrdR family protein